MFNDHQIMFECCYKALLENNSHGSAVTVGGNPVIVQNIIAITPC